MFNGDSVKVQIESLFNVSTGQFSMNLYIARFLAGRDDIKVK